MENGFVTIKSRIVKKNHVIVVFYCIYVCSYLIEILLLKPAGLYCGDLILIEVFQNTKFLYTLMYTSLINRRPKYLNIYSILKLN